MQAFPFGLLPSFTGSSWMPLLRFAVRNVNRTPALLSIFCNHSGTVTQFAAKTPLIPYHPLSSMGGSCISKTSNEPGVPVYEPVES